MEKELGEIIDMIRGADQEDLDNIFSNMEKILTKIDDFSAYIIKKYITAYEFFNKILFHFYEIKEPARRAAIACIIAHALKFYSIVGIYSTPEYTERITKLFDEVMKLLSNIKDKETYIKVAATIAPVFTVMGLENRTEKLFNEIVEYIMTIKDVEQRIYELNSLADDLAYLGLYEKAKYLFNVSIEIAKETGNTKLQELCIFGLSSSGFFYDAVNLLLTFYGETDHPSVKAVYYGMLEFLKVFIDTLASEKIKSITSELDPKIEYAEKLLKQGRYERVLSILSEVWSEGILSHWESSLYEMGIRNYADTIKDIVRIEGEQKKNS